MPLPVLTWSLLYRLVRAPGSYMEQGEYLPLDVCVRLDQLSLPRLSLYRHWVKAVNVSEILARGPARSYLLSLDVPLDQLPDSTPYSPGPGSPPSPPDSPPYLPWGEARPESYTLSTPYRPPILPESNTPLLAPHER